MKKRNVVLELSLNFALEIIRYSESLEEKRKYVVARQVLKSGTSIGANIREAQNVHSRKDFVARCMIALKEADETEYWLILCERSPSYPNPGILLAEVTDIKRILTKIITTSISRIS